MEIREFAERILLSPDLATKLQAPVEPITDRRTGPPLRVSFPQRGDSLRIYRATGGTKMPKSTAFIDPSQRGVAHHIMANHELQALEVMAWTLLAFPDAPSDFRVELIRIMIDEQRHTRMHIRRMESHGWSFGDLPVNGHVWHRARSAESLLDYLACLPLTFEGGNLDHSLQFAHLFHQAGDTKSRDVMRTIHDDEIEHVAFGLKWFRKLKPKDLSDWEAYIKHIHWPLSPYAAKGKVFQRAARERAGMSPDFIDQIKQAQPESKHRRRDVGGSTSLDTIPPDAGNHRKESL